MAARIDQVFGPMAPINDVLPQNVLRDFIYDLVYIPGGAQNNALRNRSENEAGFAQTQEEHNAALNKFADMVNLPPAIREQMGRQNEENMAKFNPAKDTKPRRPLTPSSSVVSRIAIKPDGNIAVSFNQGKEYTYNGGGNVQEAARRVMELINGGSIGRSVNTKIPGSWGSRYRL
jgi:hypothetical protein